MMNLGYLFKSNTHAFISLLLFVVVAYFPLFTGGFVFDDSPMIVNNLHIKDFNIKDIFTSCLTSGSYSDATCNFYRPSQGLFHALVFALFGLNAPAFHVISVLFHLFNTFLLFLLLQQLKFDRIVSFVAVLFFALHPMQTEAVSYISGLSDPLALFFILISTLCSLNFLNGNKAYWYLVSIVVYVFALLSKESSAVFPLVLTAFLLFSKEFKKWKFLLPFFILAVLYIVLKFTVFDFTGTGGLTNEKNIYTDHLHIRLITFLCNIPEYLKIIFLPVQLFIERPYLAYDSLLNFMAFLGLVTAGLIVWGIYRSWKKDRLFLLGAFWLILFMAPVSGIIAVNAMYLEHWLYIPSVGLSILLAMLITKYINKNWFIYMCMFVLVLFLGRTIARNMQWADPIKFYTNEIKHNPSSARVYNNLAMEYASIKDYPKAITNYKKAIAVYDVYPQSHYNLANSYLALNRVDEAVHELYVTVYMYTGFLYAHNTLEAIYKAQGRNDKAAIFNNFVERIKKGESIQQKEIEQVYKMP